MAKLTLTDITSGYASVTQLNDNFTAIETAIENTLSRDGTVPNQMTADLDMNGQSLLNVSDATTIAGVSIGDIATAGVDSAASAAAALVSETNARVSELEAEAAANLIVDWEYVGNWTTATAYVKNNITYSTVAGDSYICLVDHTSGVLATDAGAGKWGLLALHATVAGVGDMFNADNLSGLADVPTARANLGLTIGTHVQAYDAELAAIAGLTSAADVVPRFTGSETAEVYPLTSGTYTPTVLYEQNGTVTANAFTKYMRVGPIVYVQGYVSATVTTASTFTFVLSLPVASNLTASTDLVGMMVASSIGSQTLGFSGNSSSDGADMSPKPAATGSQTVRFSFTYEVK